MKLVELLREVKQKGIKLYLDEGRLAFKAPPGALDKELKSHIVRLKPEIIELLSKSNKDDASQIIHKERAAGDTEVTSFSQNRLWMLDKIEGGSAHYNIPGCLKLTGHLNREALSDAFNSIIERHESIRTNIVEAPDGNPMQIIRAASAMDIQFTDLSCHTQDQDETVQRAMEQEASGLFDLSRDLMLRVHLLKLSHQEHILMVTMHHIASDGWSLTVLVKEFCQLYEAYCQNADNPLEPLPVQFADYAVWQKNWLQEGVIDKQMDYWLTRLEDLPVLHGLPLDNPRPPVQSYNGSTLLRPLKTSTASELRKFCTQSDITLFMGLQSVLAILLSRYSNETDIVMGTPFANREQPEVASLIGFFVNSLVLRSDLSNHPSFKQVVAQSKQTLLDAYAHHQVPFEQIVEKLQPERNASHSPLFQVMMVLQNNEAGELTLPDLSVAPVNAEKNVAKFDLTLTFTEYDEELEVEWEYNTDLFIEGTISRMGRHFEQLLEKLLASPEEDVFSLDFLTEQEKNIQLVEWNDSASDYAKERCLHELFENIAEQNPDKTALVFNQQQLSYQQLNQKANQLAAYLAEHHRVGPESLVGVCLERSAEMIIAILAVLKAGGAYVPLDPGYPEQRLSHMLEDTALQVVVTQSDLQDKLTACQGAFITIDGFAAPDSSLFENYLNQNMPVAQTGVRSSNLAYVIYTSGSTGKPKGVEVEHRAVMAFLTSPTYADQSMTSRMASLSSFSFDGFVYDLFFCISAGASLYLYEKDLVLQSEALQQQLIHDEIDNFFVTTSLFNQLVSHGTFSGTSLKQVLVGGEKCDEVMVDKFKQNFSHIRLINGYGPTETIVFAASCLLNEAPYSCPIGKPLNNNSLLLLDEAGKLVPEGTVGELYVGGGSIARGYLNSPELTAKRFVANPYFDPHHPNSYEKLYRTGDLVRALPGGVMEYVGRTDEQVKIRGFRIEVGEVEQQLARKSQVESAVVLVKTGTSGKYLIGYIKLEQNIPQDDKASYLNNINRELNRVLPEYMVPASLTIVEEWPLTSNGKLDRKALPEADAISLEKSYVAPVTDTEKLLCDIWQGVLSLERVGVTDNFFELGGHSLLVMQIISEGQKVGLTITARQMFVAPNLGDLAAELDGIGHGQSSSFHVPENLIPESCEKITPQMLPLVDLSENDIGLIESTVPGGAANIQDIYPLAPLQEGILFHSMMEQEQDPYVLPVLFKVANKSAVTSFVDALQFVINRHDVLRTAFFWQGLAKPVQVVYRNASLPVTWLELDGGQDVLPQMEAIYTDQPFNLDLNSCPGMQVQIAEDAKLGCYYVLLKYHHIVLDHTGLEVIQKEVHQFLAGSAGQLPTAIPYRDFVAHAVHLTEQHDAEQFFASMLGDLDEPTLPFDLSNTHGNGRDVVERIGSMSVEISARVRDIAKNMKISPAVLFHAVWGMVLAGCSGRNDVVFGSVFSGRLQGSEGAQDTMGLFINTLPFRIKLGQLNARELVNQVEKSLQELIAYEQTSLALAQSCSGIPQGLPLFSAIFNYRHSPGPETDGAHQAVNDFGIDKVDAPERTSYPISLSVDDAKNAFSYKMQVVDNLDIDRFISYMETALVKLVELLESEQATAVSQVSILSEQEQYTQLETWNSAVDSFDDNVCLHELFEQQAELNPTRTALKFGDTELNYLQLNQKANQLASYLVENHRIGPESLVGVFLERSAEMVIAILAILKAGGAYVPMEPEYPEQRLNDILEDTQLQLVLSQSDLLHKLANYQHVLLEIDGFSQSDSGLYNNYPMQNMSVQQTEVKISNLAYIIYTSGSTGKPKGVEVEHQAVVAFLSSPNFVEQNSIRRMASLSSFAFDGFVYDLFFSLSKGASLHLYEKDLILHPQALQKQLINDQIDNFFVTTSLFNQMVANDTFAGTALKQVLIGGEQCDENKVSRFKQNYGDIRLINGYGPTETIVFATSCCLSERSDHPIGKVLNNNKILILDEFRKMVPEGAVGELYVGGASLARGYHKRPELTAERFVANPYVDAQEKHRFDRLYRTGDLVRALPGGVLEFVGRTDEQVKIRGFRIEVGEIEQQLTQLEQVESAVVQAKTSTTGKYLAGYVKAHSVIDDQDKPEFLDTVKHAISNTLPGYMVPDSFVLVEQWPLTSNGKLDKRALPEPEVMVTAKTSVAPDTETEKLLCGIWQEVLGQDSIGITDNFFELGGNSLNMVQIIGALNREDKAIEIGMLWKTQTIRELASLIDENAKSKQAPAIAASEVLETSIETLEQGGVVTESFELDGQINESRLRMAISKLLLSEKLQYQLQYQEGKPVLAKVKRNRKALNALWQYRDDADNNVEGFIEEQVAQISKSVSGLETELFGLAYLNHPHKQACVMVAHEILLDKNSLHELMTELQLQLQNAMS